MLPMVTDKVAVERLEEVEMLLFAGQQVVDDAHALAIAQQALGDMRADEAGRAGYDVGLWHGSPRDCVRATIMVPRRKCKHRRQPAGTGIESANRRGFRI